MIRKEQGKRAAAAAYSFALQRNGAGYKRGDGGGTSAALKQAFEGINTSFEGLNLSGPKSCFQKLTGLRNPSC